MILRTQGREVIQRPRAAQELLSGSLMAHQGNAFSLISLSPAQCKVMRLIRKDSIFNPQAFSTRTELEVPFFLSNRTRAKPLELFIVNASFVKGLLCQIPRRGKVRSRDGLRTTHTVGY